MKKKLFTLPFAFAAAAGAVQAHCPLCTVGAAAAAGGATMLGVNEAAVAVFIGAFAVSMGWWFSNLIKKQFIPLQREALILLSFILTIVPMLAIFKAVHPLYISWLGDYGTTFVMSMFLTGSIIGGVIASSAPWLSKQITKARGKALPYQGLTLTFLLLMIGGVVLQFAL